MIQLNKAQKVYSVKEVFYTLQGEGRNAGMPAVFLRFTRCNLWSGRETDRQYATCQFCDTNFLGVDGPNGAHYKSDEELAAKVKSLWPATDNALAKPLVVCTGGEPLLQLDQPLVDALHRAGFEIAVETNGTLPAPRYLDWLTVSPKAGTELKIQRAHELKLVYPQVGALPDQYKDFYAGQYFLQPMDGPQREENTRKAIEYCLANPQWRLSIQAHKYIGIR